MFKVKSNILYFNNDDEFYRFCVVPEIVTVKYMNNAGQPDCYADFNFTNEYNKAIEDGTLFCIKDENSNIFKNKAVSYRTITKPVSNLKQYFNI